MENNLMRFPWNGNTVVAEEYKGKNYVVWNGSRKKKSALILFSSNALYYPDDEKTFIQTICKKNRYEWKRIGKFLFLKKRYSKIIFVRDIYKSWYVKGINATHNSIDKLALLLKELTEGYEEVACCGVSAGGYAASVCGILIGATRVISVSGYWNLTEKLLTNPFLREESENDGSNVYLNLQSIIGGGYKDENLLLFFGSF